MKVALASFRYGAPEAGGSAIAATGLARSLASQGVEVVVIATRRERGMRVEHRDGVKIISFRPRNLYWVGDKDRQPPWRRALWQLVDIWNPHAFYAMRAILRQEAPDLLHCHKLRGLSPAAWGAARAAGVRPILQTCHDYELMSPEGTLNGRLGAWARAGALPLQPYQQLRSRMSRLVGLASAPSRYTLRTLCAAGLFPRAQRHVVPNTHGLDAAQLASRAGAPPAHDAGLRLLYLGRLERSKGVDLLCQAFERCAASFPGLRLDLAGWGGEEQALRQRYGHHPSITFHGARFGAEKAALLAASDALVLPSAWPEVFGIVVAEAYAYGKPVIASTAGALPEVVAEGETGLLVAQGDARALETAISIAAANPQLLRSMRPACLSAAERYTVEAVTGQYYALYQGLLAPLAPTPLPQWGEGHNNAPSTRPSSPTPGSPSPLVGEGVRG